MGMDCHSSLISTPKGLLMATAQLPSPEICPTSIEVAWPVMVGLGVRGLRAYCDYRVPAEGRGPRKEKKVLCVIFPLWHTNTIKKRTVMPIDNRSNRPSVVAVAIMVPEKWNTEGCWTHARCFKIWRHLEGRRQLQEKSFYQV
ncbi:hypothetical protein AVEN_57189-1 [Araneus ventricosus]|uniref:Uncharacterized protein n=1 Tax=Araneus ventricosus TaxID=182803 RepID=A0A4Y2SMI3_ARAVE|nr:hypothetical protein AVEN_57189-1 [Araneus ventricosus]